MNEFSAAQFFSTHYVYINFMKSSLNFLMKFSAKF